MVLGITLWGACTVITWMKDASHQPIARLILTGKRDYTTDNHIRQAILLLGTSGTLMTQDVDVIRQQIERLPWIKKINVRKQWPDKLKIHLEEYVPVARWNDLRKVDANGISFSEPIEWVEKQTFPLLYGPEGSENEVLEAYRSMSSILSANKYQLKTVAMSARHSWQLVINNNARLELGRDDRIVRLQRFIELYPLLKKQAQSENKRVNYVDLRYESGASVGWAPLFINSQAVEAPKNSN